MAQVDKINDSFEHSTVHSDLDQVCGHDGEELLQVADAYTEGQFTVGWL